LDGAGCTGVGGGSGVGVWSDGTVVGGGSTFVAGGAGGGVGGCVLFGGGVGGVPPGGGVGAEPPGGCAVVAVVVDVPGCGAGLPAGAWAATVGGAGGCCTTGGGAGGCCTTAGGSGVVGGSVGGACALANPAAAASAPNVANCATRMEASLARPMNSVRTGRGGPAIRKDR
jgi:hypothetical protein